MQSTNSPAQANKATKRPRLQSATPSTQTGPTSPASCPRSPPPQLPEEMQRVIVRKSFHNLVENGMPYSTLTDVCQSFREVVSNEERNELKAIFKRNTNRIETVAPAAEFGALGYVLKFVIRNLPFNGACWQLEYKITNFPIANELFHFLNNQDLNHTVYGFISDGSKYIHKFSWSINFEKDANGHLLNNASYAFVNTIYGNADYDAAQFLKMMDIIRLFIKSKVVQDTIKSQVIDKLNVFEDEAVKNKILGQVQFTSDFDKDFLERQFNNVDVLPKIEFRNNCRAKSSRASASQTSSPVSSPKQRNGGKKK